MYGEQNEQQAKKLQQLFTEVNNQEKSGMNQETPPSSEFIEIDVLQLPPRSEVHQSTKWGFHLKLSSPWVRFSLIISVLAVVLFVIYYFYSDSIHIFFTLEGM